MTKQTKYILHIGKQQWQPQLRLPDHIIYHEVRPEEVSTVLKQRVHVASDTKEEPLRYDALILSDLVITGNLDDIDGVIQPYTIVCDPQATYGAELATFMQKKRPQHLDLSEPQAVIDTLVNYFFNGQYGSKLPVSQIHVLPSFQGKIHYDGSAYVVLEGTFGKTFSPVCSWRYNVVLEQNRAMDLWLEYICQSSCDVLLQVQCIGLGGNDILKEWTLRQADMAEPLTCHEAQGGYLSFSLWAKGEGEICLGPLHHRYSNDRFGTFILGGQRYSDSKRQEFIHYFNPGNLKPPLIVYFSGYRPAEGFEGYWMLNSLGHPFLLFGDPRLEGGAFYMGSPEYEHAILQVIQDCLDTLNFDHKQLILSGLSMGTFGALYYGSQCSPHAIIVGKPLTNVGTIAALAKRVRPHEFHTAFDVLNLHTGGTSMAHVTQLNQRFWDHFSDPSFQDTLIAVSYMKHDDYDPSAYYDMIEHSLHDTIKMYGNGWIGRHNDNSSAITTWFYNQYKDIITRDFGGKLE